MLPEANLDTIIILCHNLHIVEPIKIIKKKYNTLPFTPKDVFALGITRYQLHALIKAGAVEKIGYGVYQITSSDLSEENKFRSALYLVGKPSCICLLSALEHYHLTDHISNKIWIMVPMKKRSAFKEIKTFRCRSPKWRTGIIKKDGFQITSIERTIVDALVYKRIIGANVGISALKQALQENKTTLKKVSDMATALKVFHRIRSVIEVFA